MIPAVNMEKTGERSLYFLSSHLFLPIHFVYNLLLHFFSGDILRLLIGGFIIIIFELLGVWYGTQQNM